MLLHIISSHRPVLLSKMSSGAGGQWEYVRGKSGKNKQGAGDGGGKMSKTQKKKLAENMPRIEPLEPLKESSTIYQALLEKEEKDEQKKSPVPTKAAAAKKPNQAPAKKGKKQTANDAADKKHVQTDLSVLLPKLDAGEVGSLVAAVRLQFPSSPLVWLKDLAAFLNDRLSQGHYESATFAGQPMGYPLSALSRGVRTRLEEAMAPCSEQALDLFWEHCLNAMLQDGAKNLPNVGYRLCLQLLAAQHPRLVVARDRKSVV